MSVIVLYLRLFFEFAKTGLFAVGGGLATLPFLTKMSTATGWFTQAELADMVAISESTPGPIGVNMASYVGYTTGSATGLGVFGGLLGSIIATLGLITPSIIIIIIVAGILKRFSENKYVQNAFYGLRPASVGMIAAAFISIVTVSIVKLEPVSLGASFVSGLNFNLDVKAAVLAVLVYFATKIKTKKNKALHPGVFLAASAVVGILFHFAG